MLKREIFSPDHEIVRQSVRRFVEAEIVPFHADWERDGRLPRDVWLKAGSAGLLCCDAPAEYGGHGLDFLHNVIVVEEVARAGTTGASGFSLHSDMFAPYLWQDGTEEQKRRWLPRLTDGTMIGAIAMTEPGAGSDLQSIRTSAVRQGDEYVVNGQKLYISNGQLADLILVACKTERDAGADGISLIFVEADRDGFRRGRNLQKVGLKAQDTSELFFSNVRVPVGNLLGGENRGFRILMQKLARERLIQAVRSATVCETALGWTVSYTKERRAFGQPIAAFQNTQFVLAELCAKTLAGRTLVDRCIGEFVSGSLDPVAAAAAKMLLTDLHCEVVDRCVQFFGGYGYMLEYPIARAYADARVTRITGGSAEIMKLIIARRMFG